MLPPNVPDLRQFGVSLPLTRFFGGIPLSRLLANYLAQGMGFWPAGLLLSSLVWSPTEMMELSRNAHITRLAG